MTDQDTPFKPLRTPHNWEKPLEIYLCGTPVDTHLDARMTDCLLEDRNADHLSGKFANTPFIDGVLGVPHFRLYQSGHSFSLWHRSENRMIANMDAGSAFVCPQFRNRGIMSALFKLQDEADERYIAKSFSIAGVMNRVRVHRLHVQDALDRGESVPAAVLADYQVTDGRARLKVPFDIDSYNDRHDEIRATVKRFHHEYLAAHQIACFQRCIDGDVENLSPYERDHNLALEIITQHGGQIRTIYGRAQVLLDTIVVDAYGIRHVENADTEAYLRRKFSDIEWLWTPYDKPESAKTFDCLDDYSRDTPLRQPANTDQMPSIAEMMIRVNAGLHALTKDSKKPEEILSFPLEM